jgi:hypothetical protein
MSHVEIKLGTVRRCKHTGKYVALVDAVDAEWAGQFNWTADVSSHGRNVYAVRRVKYDDGTSRKVYMHRELWQRVHGAIPDDLQIDHREHGEVSGLDNRRCNLRLATETLNAGNQRRRRDNTSGYKGVSWSKQHGCWEAYVTCAGQRTPLGLFRSAENAARAYDVAAVDKFGEFAKINFEKEVAA